MHKIPCKKQWLGQLVTDDFVAFLLQKILHYRRGIVEYRRYRHVTVTRCWRNSQDIGFVKIGIAVVPSYREYRPTLLNRIIRGIK